MAYVTTSEFTVDPNSTYIPIIVADKLVTKWWYNGTIIRATVENDYTTLDKVLFVEFKNGYIFKKHVSDEVLIKGKPIFNSEDISQMVLLGVS